MEEKTSLNQNDECALLQHQLSLAQGSIKQLKSQAQQSQIIASLVSSTYKTYNHSMDDAQCQQQFLQSLVTLTQSHAAFVLRYDNSRGQFELENFLHAHRHLNGSLKLQEIPTQVHHMSQNISNDTLLKIQKFIGCECFYWHFNAVSNRVLILGTDYRHQQTSVFFQLSPSIADDALQLYNDLSLYKQYEKNLQIRSSTDPLTGLPNRTVAFDRLSRAMINRANESKLVFTLFINISHFKDINEAHGHDTGDEILKIIAKRISDSVRDSDTVAALGGDEFVVLLENANKAKAAQVVASKIIDKLNEPVFFHEHDLLISCNIGIAAYPGDGENASTLIRNADAAMHDSRKMGINRFRFFKQAMNQEIAQRMRLEQSLYKAVQEQQFQLFYQPVVDGKSGKLHGAEALIRWHHDDLGYVSPDKFIPIAEEDGLIVPLGHWILDTAISQLATWQAQGCDLHMAINISVRQLIEEGFVEHITSLCKRYKVPHESVELEVTEGILLTNEEGEGDVLRALHKLGFKLSMDDFGTGYSALSYLNDFEFDYLKIDRSFVTKMLDSHKDHTLVTAIIAMAQKLDMKVIAEGVEDWESLSHLIELNCDLIQGYAISKAVPAESFALLIDKQKQSAFEMWQRSPVL